MEVAAATAAGVVGTATEARPFAATFSARQTVKLKPMNNDHLTTYLNDHLAGSVAGIELVERCLSNNEATPLGTYLNTLVSEIKQDQAVLKEVLKRLGGGVNPLKTTAAWLGEKAGRVKLNNKLFDYSELSRLEELEGLLLGVRGKLALWTALETAVTADTRLSGVDFGSLARRAEEQLETLEQHRLAGGCKKDCVNGRIYKGEDHEHNHGQAASERSARV